MLNRRPDDVDVTTIQQVELGALGPLLVRQFGLPVAIPGAKPRAVLTMLGLHGGSVVAADTLVELLWGDDPPRTAAKALQTHISALRRALGDGFVLTQGTGWSLSTTEVDATRFKAIATSARSSMSSGDAGGAAARFGEALTLWRGAPELPDSRRGRSERTRWVEAHAALVEDRADALLATGRAAEIIGELEAAIADAPLRERRWGQLMLALYRAGRQGEALAAYQRVRSLLVDELGVDPGPDLRRLEAAIVAQDVLLDIPVAHRHSSVTRAMTFLLTDIEGSTVAWEEDADAMAVALARHDEIVEQVVTSRGGRLIKTRGEGDATFSVFDRPSSSAAAAVELQDAIRHEPWAMAAPLRIRVALHTGEVEFRDGDYFGRAVNRVARLRSLAAGGQILCSGATAELVIDSLADDVILADLGTRQLKNLTRPERVFELRLETAADTRALRIDAPIERPALPAVLAGPGLFVGRGGELERLLTSWHATLTAGASATLVAGEPGVGKTRLAGEWSRQAHERGAIVLYGRCDEDLGAPYQPFAEAMRALVPCLGTGRLRGLRGVEALLPLVPGIVDVLPDLAPPPRADADTERYALFDAVVGLLGIASASASVVLILDDLHWAAKPTLLLLRHLLRFGEHARVQIVGTYRSTDLDRSHPLAAMLADLNRDGGTDRLQLGGLDEDDVTTYVAASGYDDEDLARALATVTGGNPFFLIEALRHVDESGGRWDPSTLPQGVREAVSRRLSRLSVETNKALGAAAVVGSRFAVDLVERVVEQDLVDEFDQASKAGIVIEEPGGWYRFNHAIVRQSLLAELASVRRMRLHQRIAVALEDGAAVDDELLAELAYHYFECAWAGNAAKAVDYCRRAAEQAMARLAYEGAADLYGKALHALAELDDDLPDRDEQHGELLIARCEALLAAGDVVSATGAVAELRMAAIDSDRLEAWGVCFDGQLSVLTDPERLDEIESSVGSAAVVLAELKDAAGEAKAHTVRAACLGRLGRIGDCEAALDQALTAARRAGEHRRVNAVLANAPLAALWGPNPVPRAGGRCLDVVRLLRITTGSPVVEAASTRCQGVLDAFRGRASSGRQLTDSARRSLTDLGMRHALLEVEQFAGIIELVAEEPTAAEEHLRLAYNGFRRMRLDADTAETAALLARACLALGRYEEADELCTESEHLAGHALKASISWRTVRALLLARGGVHDDARRVAEEAVAIAERTDALVDHGDACLVLAAVLNVAGDTSAANAAAARAVELYELKGAAALADKARGLLDAEFSAESPTDTPVAVDDNACVQVIRLLDEVCVRGTLSDSTPLFAVTISLENRRKIVASPPRNISHSEWVREARRFWAAGVVRIHREVVAVRGDRLALLRTRLGTADESPGAAEDHLLHLMGLDGKGRIALHMSFDLEDMDAALAELNAQAAQLERVPALENTASRVYRQGNTHFSSADWASLANIMSPNMIDDDRRRVVNAGVRHGRDSVLSTGHAVAETGTDVLTSTVAATRGERLALCHSSIVEHEQRTGVFQIDFLSVVETDGDEKLVAHVAFDVDDFDSAVAELDARYLVGEAAPHAHTWSVVIGSVAALDEHEFPARTYVEAVHRLSDLGVVIQYVATGTARQNFDATWRGITVSIVEGEQIHHSEQFDETDLEAALVRFDELRTPPSRLENAASRVCEHILTCFENRKWHEMGELVADDICHDDRRRIVNGGATHRRETFIGQIRSLAEIGLTVIKSTVIATRGERLVLSRAEAKLDDQRSDGFKLDVLDILEIDTDGRVIARIVFDGEELDAAFAELDARYLAGEAAPHEQAWLTFVEGYAAFNRGELPRTARDSTSIDHRRGAAFAPGELVAYLQAAWKDSPGSQIHVEVVHRLSDRGAVVTHVAAGMSREGFDAEWRDIAVATVHSGMMSRFEVFDEVDLDAALARFGELTRPVRRLENAASRMYDRFNAYFAARDWGAMAATVADDVWNEDRRRVVNGGVQRGRDAVLANMRAVAGVGVKHIELSVLATRGNRLALVHQRIAGDQRPEAYGTEVLIVVEVDADSRFAAGVAFELNDIKGAFAELDARYTRGEAAAYAHTWSVIARNFANDVVDLTSRIETVHRLSQRGAVVTQASRGNSQHGFEAEWREINVAMVDGRLVMCAELFDEDDLDGALARFDELSCGAGYLANAASRTIERFVRCFATSDWDAITEILGSDFTLDDRRRVVGAGIRHGRDAEIEDLRAFTEVGLTNAAYTVLATRGERLVLSRTTIRRGDSRSDEVHTDMFSIAEVDAGGRMIATAMFDPDDLDSAFAELDARYVTGEAAAHAHIWSAIAATYAAVNRHALSETTPDWVNIDHRRGLESAVGETNTYVSGLWTLVRDVRTRIEAVHRLSSLGAVFTHTKRGSSREGFDTEWREVALITFDGAAISRCEVFDEADLNAALARFDELSRSAPGLENAASRAGERLAAAWAGCDWKAVERMLHRDFVNDDRRSVVNAGVRHGRDAEIDDLRASADIGFETVSWSVAATRGENLALTRARYARVDENAEGFYDDVLHIVELNADGSIASVVIFDSDDLDSAFAELDQRYLAGEAAAYSHAWTAILDASAAFNRQVLPRTTADWGSIDHRSVIGFAPGEMMAYMRATWDVAPQVKHRILTVHRVSELGAIFTQASDATSPEGFNAEWREVAILTLEGAAINRCEVYDEQDLEIAVLRYDELTCDGGPALRRRRRQTPTSSGSSEPASP